MDGAPARQQRIDVTYTCGECGADNQIKPREPIRCKDCGYRIMYKKRTKRMVQFEAR
ncbi:DNA-directed RNA polymerase core subunit rpc10 [Polyrhizophydium stewartii]|uniref:DNA-directed RNA polymerase core subunit rpc10 n=1 Tax=Polyrhizophydium stewartii TaxID=2732419 RepID=A0ABR4NAJ2_9FUNG